MKASGIILAGGQSRRMKTNKALIKFNKEVMIGNIISALHKVVTEIIIVSNEPTDYLDFDAMLVTDLIPGFGPLSGIHAGLKAASFEYGFVTACDMPFLSPGLIDYMIGQAEGFDAIVPRIGEYYQPLHAVYSKKCIKPIEKSLKAGNSKVTSFYETVNINYIKEQDILPFASIDKVFFNVNSPVDLAKAQEMAGDEDGSKN